MLTLKFDSFPVLATERLILREQTINDAATLFLMRNNDEIMQYIDREKPKSVQDSEKAIALMADGYAQDKNLVWAIALKEKPNLMIGSIGYYRTDFANYRAEIGYMLIPAYWRQGIIAEALKQTIAFGFEEMKLHSISANINPGNNPSRQILLKHNFVKEAYFREDYYFNGKFLDSEIYSLLQKDITWRK